MPSLALALELEPVEERREALGDDIWVRLAWQWQRDQPGTSMSYMCLIYNGCTPPPARLSLGANRQGRQAVTRKSPLVDGTVRPGLSRAGPTKPTGTKVSS